MSINYSDKIYRVNCLASDLESLYHQAALKLGLSDSVMFVLYMIYENGGSSLLYDIRKETSISKQTLNSAIRKLESEDIIYLEQHGGKAKRVCLTDKGKNYVDQTVARLFKAECSAFNGWTEEEINLYLNFMERYNINFREQIEKL